MAIPVDYLVAAAVIAIRRRASIGSLPQDRGTFRNLIEQINGFALDDESFDKLISRLRNTGLLYVLDDEYAGEIFNAQRMRSSFQIALLSDAVEKGLSNGSDWLRKVFENPKYWADLKNSEDPDGEVSPITKNDTEIPASDRVVTVNHNQFKNIEEPTSEIIVQLEQDNGLPEDPGFREQILGQLKAGRELLRAGVFRISVFQFTLVAALQSLAERYKDHAIGAAASALLTVILHELGLPGF